MIRGSEATAPPAGEIRAAPPPSWRAWAFLTLIFALAVLFRSYRLGSLPGLNGDEAWYGVRLAEWGAHSLPWKTPTGNPLNPFYILPLALMQWLFAPALWSLRSVAWISGLLTIAVGYWVVRRQLGVRMALLAAVLLAWLPLGLANSRFGWDPSQSVLFVWILLAAILSGRYFWAAGAFLAAVWVHPTNIFVTPLVVLVVAWREQQRGWLDRRKVMIGLLLGLLAAGLVLWRFGALVPFRRIADNASSLAAWGESARLFSQLFSGTTVYRYISGAGRGADALVLDWIWAAIHFGALVIAPIWAWRQRRWQLLIWPLGIIVSLLLFHLLVGPRGLRPGAARYAFWSVAPVIMNLMLQIAAWLPKISGRRGLIMATTGIALVGLVSFANNYFGELLQSGGRAHRTFRTTEVEPKQAIYDLVKRDRGDDKERIRLYASSWWSYQTLNYLMAHGGELSRGDEIVMLPRGARDVGLQVDRVTYLVAFPGERLNSLARSRPQIIAKRYTVTDPRGKALLYLYRLRR